MKKYIDNPKLKGSGIIGCIPQSGTCPMDCEDCFFQSGRSYLEPLNENLPNMPEDISGRVVRVNDGNDSNNLRNEVMSSVAKYPMKFYNTSIPHEIGGFDAPVVLTVNPAKRTDNDPILLKEISKNLMFVRVRTNTWNINETVIPAVEYYTSREVPVVLTFMAYYKEIPVYIKDFHKNNYIFRKRTLNPYYTITTAAWRRIMATFQDNIWVYSCGKIEGEKGKTACRHCGNCLREYFATMERMRDGKK
jgi:hypothetical protein